MPKSTKADTIADTRKPELPTFDPVIPKDRKPFPLFCHASGRWAKKVLGSFAYFGYWRGENDLVTPAEAAARWHEQREDLMAGRKPRVADDGAMTITNLVNHFLTAKLAAVEAGELSRWTFKDYQRCGKQLIEYFGGRRLAEDMKPVDFTAYRAKLAARYSPIPLGREIQMVRTLFQWGHDSELLNLPRFGPEFKRPKPTAITADRNAKPVKFFEAVAVRKLIDKASQPMRSFILLAVNCGLGNTDLSGLRMRHLDLDGGWINYPRGKTGIDRRLPLWKRTVDALREAIAARPAPADPADADRVFLTIDGNPYLRMIETREESGKVKITPIDAIAQQFGRLMKITKLTRAGVGLYSLRHTFSTIGKQCSKRITSMMMGHRKQDDESEMDAHYDHTNVDSVAASYDDRRRRVAAHVEAWLDAEPKGKPKGKAKPAALKLAS